MSSSSSEDDGVQNARTSFIPPSTPVNCLSTPTTRGQFALFKPPRCLVNLSGEFESDDEESFRFLRQRNVLSFETSTDDSTEVVRIPNSACLEPLSSYVYIDDYNIIERVWLGNAASHNTVKRREVKVLAAKSELQLSLIHI